MLTNPAFSLEGPANRMLTTETRSLGAVAGAVIAVLLCANRWKASKSYAQVAALLKGLPVAFVLSDKNGTLLYVSEEAWRLMDIPRGEAVGQSYFSLLFNLSEKGASVQRYMNLLDSDENKLSSVELGLRGSPNKSWHGTWMPVDLPSGRCLITVIEPASAA